MDPKDFEKFVKMYEDMDVEGIRRLEFIGGYEPSDNLISVGEERRMGIYGNRLYVSFNVLYRNADEEKDERGMFTVYISEDGRIESDWEGSGWCEPSEEGAEVESA